MKIKTALILCAGYGKRLLPLTKDNPKPLLKVNGLTLLERNIILIKKLGVEKIIINTFYLNKLIKEFIDSKNFGVTIEIVNDGDKILETGGGILNMINFLKEKNFFVFNPDTIWDDDYISTIKKMEKYYFSKDIENILMVVNKNLSFDKGLKGDFNFVKQNLIRSNINDYIFTGCQIISKNLFKEKILENFSISEIWNSLIKVHKLYGFESKNKFFHVTNLSVYQKLLKN